MLYLLELERVYLEMRKIQVLVATMNQTDHSLIEKMNINTSAIIGNQCNQNHIDEFEWRGNKITYLNFNERGVGLNRNNALMRADADICIFADDDVVYVDEYEALINKAFDENPKADVIIFNLIEKEPTRYINRQTKKVGRLNYLRYGTVRIAIKLNSVKEKGIYFNQCFGGGTEHCHGEDNIFLNSCIRSGLNVVAVPYYIAELTEERASTWDQGFNEKYIKDQGCLYKTISPRFWKLLCLQDAVRRSKRDYKMSWINAYNHMISKGE